VGGSARRALVTSIGLMLVRRRLQKQGGLAAAGALLGLELFGPRILGLRRLLGWVLALTLVGAVVLVALWWLRRRPPEADAVTGGPEWEPPLAPTAPADWAPAPDAA
jgi:hypothetical protein